MQHGWYGQVSRLVVELGDWGGQPQLCIAGTVHGRPNIVAVVVELGETSRIYDEFGAAWWLVELVGGLVGLVGLILVVIVGQ